MLKFSVIISVYNTEKMIRRTLDSAIEQTLPHDEYEIIAIDNQSTDAIHGILLEYGQKYPKLIKVVQCEKNSAVPAVPGNLGIDEAQAQYITFMHSGDAFDSDFLEKGFKFAAPSDYDYILCKIANDQHFFKGDIGATNPMNDKFDFPLDILGKIVKRKTLNDFGVRFNPKYHNKREQFFCLQCICSFKSVGIMADKEYAFPARVDSVSDEFCQISNADGLYNEEMEFAGDCLSTIMITENLPNDEKMKACAMIVGNLLSLLFLFDWLKYLEANNKTHQERFKHLAALVNNKMPVEADKSCCPELWLTLFALRNNDFQALIKYTNHTQDIKNQNDTLLLDLQKRMIHLEEKAIYLPLDLKLLKINRNEKQFSKLTLYRKNGLVDFLLYIKAFIEDFIILLSVKDTSCKRNEREDVEYFIFNYLGLKIKMNEIFRSSYIAVLDGGDVIYENSSGEDATEPLAFKYKAHNITVFEVVSGGFNSGNISSIKVNGHSYAMNKRGINMVVYHKEANQVVDSICFDGFGGKKFRRADHKFLSVIFNADDFGFTGAINRAIINCFKAGTVLSTSIMANSPAYGEAVALALENPLLGVGIHLNITHFKPLLNKNISSLIDRDGNFIRNTGFGARKLSEIKAEWTCQIEKALLSGISLTHLDSHHHMHLKPELVEIAIDLAKNYNLPMRVMKKMDNPPSPYAFCPTSSIGDFSKLKDSIIAFKNDQIKIVEYGCHPSIIDHDYLIYENWSQPRICDYINLYINSKDLIEFCRNNDILITNYKLFKGWPGELIEHERLINRGIKRVGFLKKIKQMVFKGI